MKQCGRKNLKSGSLFIKDGKNGKEKEEEEKKEMNDLRF